MRGDVRRFGLQHAVRCDGAVADPRAYLQAADAFVLPSWHDACSLSVLEACACGLPVMTTRANGASELLTHDDEGYIIESAADIQAIGKALMDLALPENRARLGPRARQTAEVYDVTRNVDQIERVYREVAARTQLAPQGSRPA
jgi:UDP-glucose:(heptosyl)LPS alpha-1,3-glucosyltransferase